MHKTGIVTCDKCQRHYDAQLICRQCRLPFFVPGHVLDQRPYPPRYCQPCQRKFFDAKAAAAAAAKQGESK